MRYYKAAIPVLGALLMSSCLFKQHHPDKKDGTKETPPPLCLGAVHQVYADFVLLRIIGPMPSPGTTLVTHPADGSVSRLGNVCVTTEKTSHNTGIIAADIRSGTIFKGDRVFLYRDISDARPAEDTPATEEKQDTPTPATTEPADKRLPGVIPTPAGDADNTTPNAQKDDTTVEEKPQPTATEEKQDTPSIPLPSGSPGTAPSYLDDIPDNIDGWN